MKDQWVKIPKRGFWKLLYIKTNIDICQKNRSHYQFQPYLAEDPGKCDICWVEISKNADGVDSESDGFYGNESWVCCQCHEIFIVNNNPYSTLSSFITQPT